MPPSVVPVVDVVEVWAEVVDAVVAAADLKRLLCKGYDTTLVWKGEQKATRFRARCDGRQIQRRNHISQRSQWALGVLGCLFNNIKEDYKWRQRIANNTWSLHLCASVRLCDKKKGLACMHYLVAT